MGRTKRKINETSILDEAEKTVLRKMMQTDSAINTPDQKLTSKSNNTKKPILKKQILKEKNNNSKGKSGDPTSCNRPPKKKSKLKACFNCGESSHVSRDCPKPRITLKVKNSCYVCGQSGHYAKQCMNEKNMDPKLILKTNIEEEEEKKNIEENNNKEQEKEEKEIEEDNNNKNIDKPALTRYDAGRPPLRCFNCKGYGHLSKECRKPRKAPQKVVQKRKRNSKEDPPEYAGKRARASMKPKRNRNESQSDDNKPKKQWPAKGKKRKSK